MPCSAPAESAPSARTEQPRRGKATPARRFACATRFGSAAKTGVASAALTSVGVRGTRLRTSTAHDLARSVVSSPHVAVASRRLIVVLFGNRTLNSATPSRRASETLAADEGAAQSAPPSCPSGAAEAGYGYRYRLLLASAAQRSRSVAFAAVASAERVAPRLAQVKLPGTGAEGDQRGLTTRSSGPATAGHLGPA